jgi:eukaryotic-like serine/threonine-protein kinase
VTAPADRLAAALADRYRIERELGEGGMATVYLAEDLRHHRKVAIKVLKPELAAVLGADRFIQEITTTAQLQHPNILPLFDSGEANGFLFYVMPYVDGESLRDRLDRERQLGVDEAVRITREVADALEYAHEHGVVHRDIKPENILLHAGHPVVSDFGIALAVSAAAGGRMTETGLSLGTPHYMSPEQATAEKDLTGRSDIYSLASVLYEMLTGDPPHTGSSAQQIIMKIVTEEPAPVTRLRKSVPPNVAAALSKALEKLPADRFETAKAFFDALADPSFRVAGGAGEEPGKASAAGRAGWRGRLHDPFSVVVSLVAVAAIAALLSRRSTPAPSTVPPIRFILATTDSAKPLERDVWPGAISPDGGTVVYSASAPDGRPMYYYLHTDELEAHPIPGTTGGYQPYFSPDGRWLAFEQNGEERKVRLDGSPPVTITGGGVQNNGAAWLPGDQIVIGAFGSFQGLSQVSAGGGKAVALTHVDSAQGERQHVWPIATPDPNVVVFTTWYGGLGSSKLAAASMDDGRVTPLGVQGIRPLAVLDGHLVYVQADGTIMAVPFDVRHQRVTGAPVSVHDRVGVDPTLNGNSEIYVSTGGGLVTGQEGSTLSRLVWVPRQGTIGPAVPEARQYEWGDLSPDGKRIAVVVSDNQGSDVWIWDATLSTFSRLTTVGTVLSVTWTHDGSSVVYVAGDSATQYAVWSQPVTGGLAPRRLFSGPEEINNATLSPDGESLVVQASRRSWDLLRVPLDSGAVARPYVATRFDEWLPQFSPDGKWVAYRSNETGQPEVYVRSFPDPSKEIQISVGQGTGPLWSASGNRLYYLSTVGHAAVLEARVSLSPTFRILGRDTVVSLAGLPAAFAGVSPDGTRVLGVERVSSGYRLVVSPNWITELETRLAASDGGSRRQ